ncbi:MAG: hypothetical protein ACHP84_07275 [Caulobacterales bacterium]|jgi:hypothetical protein
MNKVGLILAGAVMFDLGVVVPSGHAAYDAFLKLDNAQSHEALKIKLDKVNDAAVCRAHGGSLLKYHQVEYCKVPASHPRRTGY